MTRHVVIGTAGHIDHGKTALVRALTGIDTDRLAEEKRRGITIDLGFAHTTLPGGSSASIVDVPGHEDFIRTMVAGASGIDVALLVVAADEGVMPQTSEHLAILRMLDVPGAVVALTKSDLVEAEWLALAVDDVRARLADTRYADAAIVPVSARSGAGLGDLLRALADAAAASVRSASIALFRMPVDRGFTMHGTGTVVTGTVRDGEVAVGDELVVMPAARRVRVRGIQHHGDAVERVGPGMRAAAALAGIEKEAAGRGTWLVASEWPLTSMLTVRVDLVGDTRWELRQRQRVRLHVGTAEVMARAVLLDAPRLRGGESGLAQLRLESPVVARIGDRFVLRSYSPVTTIGGGVVLESIAPKRRRLDPQRRALLEALESGPANALGALLDDAGLRGVRVAELPLRLGVAADASTGDAARVADRLIARAALDAAGAAVLAAVGQWHVDFPLRPGMDRSEARRAVDVDDPAIVDAVLDRLVESGALRSVGGLLAAPDFAPRTDAGQAAARAQIEQIYREAGLAPPRTDELPAPLRARADLRDLLLMLEREGVLAPLPPDRLVHRDALEDARVRLGALAGREGLGPGDFRDLFDLPRKHLIPLLELFDRLGWTRRQGDQRSVAQKGVEIGSPVP